ncbi:MAG: TolC family protein [Bacteroidales bacterium]
MNYGLSVGVDIFDGFNRQREKRNARLDVDIKEVQYLQVEQQVRADLLTIYSAYINNLRLLELEEQNLATATENLEIAFERYKLGNLSGLDLREVQKVCSTQRKDCCLFSTRPNQQKFHFCRFREG